MTLQQFEFGLDTPVYVSLDESGKSADGDIVIRNTIEEAVLADAVGIDSFNIGEHYRRDFMDSAGHVILAAIAGRTRNIRLGTAVTVLSTHDPVRVYADFATLDAASDGRAQLIVGRSSVPDSFPLFGFDLADYEALFEEKLDLLVRLRDQPVTWSGTFRPALDDQYVSPPLRPGHLPIWVGSGGTAQSAIRAARHGLPLMLALVGGHPRRFKQLVELYQDACERYGHRSLPVGLHAIGYVGETDEKAAETQYPHWAEMMSQSPRERGGPHPPRERFQSEIDEGSLLVGSPETVATKLATMIKLLGLSRFDLAYALGRVPHEQRLVTIQLFGREVIPRVRELLNMSLPTQHRHD